MSDKVCSCGSQELGLFMAKRNAFVCLQCDCVRDASQVQRDYREVMELLAIKAVFGERSTGPEDLTSLRKWRDDKRKQMSQTRTSQAPEVWEPR